LKTPLLLFASLIIFVTACSAQDDYFSQVKPTKPATLFTMGGYLESFTQQKNTDRVLSEPYFQYAINANNAVVAYLPLLNITETKQAGLSDATVKYTLVLKRNILPHFIALFAGIQAGVPSGSVYSGLGSGRWIVEPSVTGIFTINPNITLVTNINYLHYTTSYIKKYITYPYNGYNVQPYVSFKIFKPLFLSASTGVTMLSSHGKSNSYYSAQLSGTYLFHHNKFNVNAYWSPSLTSTINNTFNVGFVSYFRKG